MIPKVMCFQTKPSSEFIKILSKQSPFSFGWAFVNIFVTMIAAETCARHMHVGQLPNGTVRTGACNRRTACRIQHKSFAVYFE